MPKYTLLPGEFKDAIIVAVDRSTLDELSLPVFERQYAELLLMKQKIEEPGTHPLITKHLPDVINAIETWEKRIPLENRIRIQDALKEKFPSYFPNKP